MRVLIADDEALIRMGLRTMLRDLGYNVIATAADGREAVKLACERQPDLVILDIKMPHMDGLTAAEAIARHCPMPVVLLTAYSERDLVERAAATENVQAYLVKPIREIELVPAIDLAVARYAEWRALQKEAADRRESLAIRQVVAQAKTILMARDDLTEGEAFLEIQYRARRQRQKMREIAEEILLLEDQESEA
jgi:AmiR/NasT family two-component response regulator